MKPRIFVSTVSSELQTNLQLVANVLLRLGYNPVIQEIFEPESGDLRQVLRTPAAVTQRMLPKQCSCHSQMI